VNIRESISKHKLASIFVIGILIRIVLMPISAHPYDVYSWYDVSTRILKNGPLSLQGFPPLWYHYMMVPVAYSFSWLSGISSSGVIPVTSLPLALNFYSSYNVQYVPGLLFDTVVKFPFLISDIMVAFLLYKIVAELTKSKGLAEKAAFLWFLNPFVIWISAVWGTWDTLPAFTSLVAFYFLLKKKIVFSAVFIALGVALKLYPVLFLVPIGIYLLKSSSVEDKWKNCLKFFSVFAMATFLLFLPYLGTIASSFSSYFVQNPSTSGAITNPISYPVGFGLSYWSIYLLNRLINLPVTAGFVSLASTVSIILVALALGIVYWKTSKIAFEKSVYNLVLVLLLPLFALFLSYRQICEQYFIWAIPFLIILLIGNRIKPVYFWAASIVALLYALLNLPFPFFFLPLAPWYTNSLVGMVHAFWAIESARIVTLSALGCIFSILLVLIIMNLMKTKDSRKAKI